MTGIVRCFNADKGYGFIRPLIGRPSEVSDVFVHIANVKGRVPLPKGAEVSFVIVRGNEGPQAASVELRELPAAALMNSEERHDRNGTEVH